MLVMPRRKFQPLLEFHQLNGEINTYCHFSSLEDENK